MRKFAFLLLFSTSPPVAVGADGCVVQDTNIVVDGTFSAPGGATLFVKPQMVLGADRALFAYSFNEHGSDALAVCRLLGKSTLVTSSAESFGSGPHCDSPRRVKTDANGQVIDTHWDTYNCEGFTTVTCK